MCQRYELKMPKETFAEFMATAGPIISATCAVLKNGSDGFFVAGAEGAFHPATATVQGKAVLLRSDAVAAPVRVRYAWSAAPDWTLCDEHGLPAAPFAMKSQ